MQQQEQGGSAYYLLPFIFFLGRPVRRLFVLNNKHHLPLACQQAKLAGPRLWVSPAYLARKASDTVLPAARSDGRIPPRSATAIAHNTAVPNRAGDTVRV